APCRASPDRACTSMSTDLQATVEHFRTHGRASVSAAFSGLEAARMRDVIWEALEESGIRRDDPASWSQDRPSHLQHLEGHPAFDAVGSALTLASIDAVLEGQPWKRPKDWGSFFLIFP